MDLVSFRELYGYLTADKKAEIERSRRRAARGRSPQQAEAALFGASRTLVAEATPGIIDEKERFTAPAPPSAARSYSNGSTTQRRSSAAWCSTRPSS